MSQTQTICSLNDRFRQGDMNIQGKILITSGLNHLLAEQDREASELLKKVQDYSDFDEDNDPHGEHDFGAFDFRGEKCFWKIDGVDAPSHGGIEVCQTGFVRSQSN